MIPTEKKHEFIRLRAEGRSYRDIEAEIGVSRSTCSAWAQELEAEIAITRSENLSALYTEYGLTKEARIKRLGQTLQRIDEALDEIDLSEMPPEKLLGMKLKYAEALKAEYTGAEAPLPIGGDRASESAMFYLYSDLVDRLRSGNISTQQARIEIEAYQRMEHAYSAATTEYVFGTPYPTELEPPQDAYSQASHGTPDEPRQQVEAEEPRKRQRSEAARLNATEPISQEQAAAAITATLENLIRRGDVDGLMKLLEYTMEEDADEIEES